MFLNFDNTVKCQSRNYITLKIHKTWEWSRTTPVTKSKISKIAHTPSYNDTKIQRKENTDYYPLQK